MSDYAVVNPATGETVQTYPTIGDDELTAADRAGATPLTAVVALVDGAGARGSAPARRASSTAASAAARRDHRPRDGQADRAGPGRGRLLRRHLRVLRRQRRVAARRRADRARRRRGLGLRAPQLGRRPARHHAVELPLLPGGALRRAEPGHRQHDPAQARARSAPSRRRRWRRSSSRPASRRTPTSTSTRPTSRSRG